MRIPTFSLKNEAIWMVLLTIAPLVVGLLFVLSVSLFRQFSR